MMVPPTDQQLLAALQEERERHPELAETIELHEEVIAARAEVEASLPGLHPDPEEVARLVDERVPALQRWALHWDLDGFTTLGGLVCEIGGRHRPDLALHFERTASLFTGDGDQLRRLVDAYLEDGKLELAEQPAETQGIVAFVVINALHPFLRAFATVLAPLIEDEKWYQRVCPVCGGEPDFGYLEEKVGGLRLLCSRCDVVWTYRRGECAFCGNSDKETFAYYLDDDETHRLYVCDGCQRYLKLLDGRHTTPNPLLPVQRILTIGMDIAAREQGYR
jgi:FdhE protein